MFNACNHTAAVKFVAVHRTAAEIVARELDIPTENLLGLAAHETQYGDNRFSREGNGFFSMRSPAPNQTGTMTAKGDAKVKVATFKSFEFAAQSFAKRWGNAVRGKTDAAEFSQALVKAGFNTGDSRTGGRDGFALHLQDTIKMVKTRMECRQ